MKKEWFSAAEIADEKLPGLPTSKRGVARKIEQSGWDKSEQARERMGRGGGLEYHYMLLPDVAQAALMARYGEARVAQDNAVQKRTALVETPRGATAWAWYETQRATFKDRAAQRLEALTRIDTLSRRIGRGPAVRAIAEENKVSVATIHKWLDLVRGVPRVDWLPALVPAPRGGGGTEVEIAEEVWEVIKADWLRLSYPSFNSCYRRLKEVAKANGWKVPPERTLRRRIDALPEVVKVRAREGTEAVKKLYPAQKRDRSMFHALEAVNADGHKWDVFVRWEDGTIGRPVMLAFQDLYSGKFLSWRYGKGENKDMVRLAFGDMCMSYGIPEKCWLDNGRAFASKWLTGGTRNRYRFKIKAEEPLGILTQLGVEIHWTTPYAGQSKPIERGFKDFANDIARGPQFQGAYTGNTPLAKPEDYATKAIPFEDFKRIIDHEILMHNARPGRQSQVCGGKLSFNDAFEASLATSLIRRASDEQVRICLLAAEGVRAQNRDGSVHLLGNRYWHQKLLEERGNLLTIRFDPDNVQADLPVYRRDGSLICTALLVEAAGFADTTAAREHAQARNAYMKATREQLAAEKKMSLAQLVALQPKPAAYEPPQAKVLRPLATLGNLAVKPANQTETDDDDFDTNFAKGLRLVRDTREDL